MTRIVSFATCRKTGIAALLLLLCACASVSTPEYQTPDVPAKNEWSESLGAESAIEADWWRRFGDPYLEELVQTAIDGNADLRVLAARSDVAKAYISQAQSGLFPSIAAGTSTSTTVAGQSPSIDATQYGTGAEMSWELDIWGKTRKGVAAQKAAYQASLADWRAGHLALASDVAIAYLQLRMLDEQILRQQQSIGRGDEILSIYSEMHAQGLAPQTNMLQQSAELSRQKASLIDLRTSREMAVNGLATLLGIPAGNLQIPNTVSLMEIEPVAVPAGLPSEILVRRPDIVAAEYRLLQACNLESQARLAQLPSVGLTGVGGTAALDLGDMVRTWTGGLSSFVRFPVFDANVRAQIRVSDAQVSVAEDEYRVVVMQAFEEVENALTSVSGRKMQSVELEHRRASLATAEQDVQAQLDLGLVSYLDVLEGQRSMLDAEQQLLINRWQTLMDTVALYKAVGGGWPPEDVGS
jgi:NodT family efflux transporter outer membrane factor (OMF) lipoprotein